MTRTITLSPEDSSTIRAILLTHAEMQDQRAIPSMELVSRLRKDNSSEDDTVMDMIEDLEDQVEVFEKDSDNLKRIADMFM